MRTLRKILEDVRDATRALGRQRRITLLSLLILGLGLGLATAVSSIASGLLLRGLPFPGSEQLVAVSGLNPEQPDRRLPVPLSDLRAWTEAQTTLSEVAYFRSWFSYLTWPGGGTEVYVGSAVAPELFSALRVGPRLGRLPLAEDCRLGRPVVVLSDAIWQDRFGRSPSVLGSKVLINRKPYTVVGVMPHGFAFPFRQHLWTVLCPPSQEDPAPVFVVARLRPGVSLAAADTELQLISQRRAATATGMKKRLRARVEPYVQSVTDPNLGRALAAVASGAALLLFVCCCTVALLLLLATLRQQTSIAVRTALGAPPWRAAAQSLLGTLLLSILGALLGLALAKALTVLFNLLVAPAANLRGFWVDVRLDTTTLLAAMLGAILAIPLCGVPPAFRAARTDPMAVLRRSSVAGSLGSVGWPSRLLVAGQVALSCVLLVGAAITTSAGVRLARYSYGFDTSGLFTSKVSLYAIHGIDEATPDQQARLYLRVLERVRAVAGVRAAAISSALPTQVRSSQDFLLPGEDSSRKKTARVLKGELGPAGDRAMRAGLDRLAEERPLVPDERPGLGVVEEKVELLGGHLPATTEDVGGDIVGGSHAVLLLGVATGGIAGSPDPSSPNSR